MENKLIAVGSILKAAKVFARIGDLATVERLASEAAVVLISIKKPITEKLPDVHNKRASDKFGYAQGGSKYGI